MDVLAHLRRLLPQAMNRDAAWARARLDQATARLARGQPAERSLGELTDRLERSVALAEARAAQPLHLTFPETLPVAARHDEILDSLRRHPVLVLTGETGSGKTTQLPKMLLELGLGQRGPVALTQPRRVAAVAMAERIGEELEAPTAVAHSVRFDDRATDLTMIRVMTDGLLLAEASSDQDFSAYDAVMVDEAHERSLNIDLLLGLLKRARIRRPELRLVISSASIEAVRFAEFFAEGGTPAPVIHVSGRMFPVEIRHQPPVDDDVGYLDAAIRTIREVHDERRDGDILAFLPTERDIIEAGRRLDDLGGASVLPLFSRLNAAEQRRVFQPARGRKIVLATNIAETSLTLPGITTVVDTGLARIKRYHAASRTERLPIEAVSQASATQRAGRAGRVAPGVCIRLYDAEDLAGRDAFAIPEILRSNLAGVLLTCLHLGLGDPADFPWLDAPSTHAWQQARMLLDELGAMADGQEPNADGRAAPLRLSALGRTLARIPADPQVARILVAGVTEGVPHEAATISAFLSIQDPRVRPLEQEAKADSAHRGLAHEAGDLATVLRLWDRWQAAGSGSQRRRLCQDLFLSERRMREWADVRHQLWSSLRDGYRGGNSGGSLADAAAHAPEEWPLDRIHRAVLAGMLGNVLMWDAEKTCYRAAGDRQLAVHPSSALRSGKADDGKRAPAPLPWLVACEVVETSRLFARLCAPIDPAWVLDLAGDRVRLRHRDPQYHPQRRMAVVVETVFWKGLPIREGRMVPLVRIDPVQATAIFIRDGMASDEGAAGLRELPVLAANRRVLLTAGRLRHRLRDPALYVEPELLAGVYARRLAGSPAPIACAADLLAWIRDQAGPATTGGPLPGRHRPPGPGPDVLRISLSDLVDPALAERAERDFPETVRIGGLTLTVVWRYAPGDADDGATITVHERDLGRLDPTVLDWLIPGWIDEQVQAWLEHAPKDVRRALIPLAASAAELAQAVRATPGQASVTEVLAGLVFRRTGHRVVFDHADLPDWQRLRFRVLDEDEREIYAGRDRAAVLAQAAASGDRLRPLHRRWDTEPTRGWPGDCPAAKQDELGVSGFVALARARAADGTVAVRRTVFASQTAATAWHDDGLDAALESALGGELTALATARAPVELTAMVQEHLGLAVGGARRQLALMAALDVERPGIRDADGFARMLEQARTALVPAARAADQLLADLARSVADLRTGLRRGAKTLAAAAIARDLADELDRLIGPGWATRRFFSASVKLPAAVQALSARLALATRDGAAAQRLHDRSQALLGALDHAEGDGDPRLIDCLGERRRLRRLYGLHVACVAFLGQARAGATGGQAEAQLRTEAAELARRQRNMRDRIAATRGSLLDARLAAGRLATGASRRLTADLDRFIAGYPDLGLGADLDAQQEAAAALLARLASVR